MQKGRAEMKYVLLFMLVYGGGFFISSAVAEVKVSRHLNAGVDGVALQGYDPVSYFSGSPLLGKTDFAVIHGGIQYQFVGRESMEQFKESPAKYLPAYGGWCAWAMLDGEKVQVHPERFKIIAGTNYLFYDGFWGNTLQEWDELAEKKSEEALVTQAGAHWQKIVSE